MPEQKETMKTNNMKQSLPSTFGEDVLWTTMKQNGLKEVESVFEGAFHMYGAVRAASDIIA